MKKIVASILAGLGLATASCQPVPPAPAAGPTASVLVVGDSITWQAARYLPWEVSAYMGWTMSDVEQLVWSRRDAGAISTLVVALGTNDSNPVWNGGWTATDENLWSSVILNLHPDTPVVLIKPWLGPGAVQSHVDQVAKARAYVDALASLRPNTVVVDWADYGAGQLASDGVHLAFDVALGDPYYNVLPSAVAARQAAIEAGLARFVVT